MQFSTVLLSAIAFFAGAEACKCLAFGGNYDLGASHSCCDQQHGSWRNGNDCAASSISEHLSNFRTCCKSRGSQTSDCDYPRKRAVAADTDVVVEDGIKIATVDGVALTIVERAKIPIPTHF
ncbi:hypothetical protein QR685DRAFT_481025 [Neurospora intermedia]|uniref:Uncharacterized protein n=1 Tax=Neurospora intermedia TaxID=5142 RepID=A0ABR3D4F4_NEUIN